MKKHCKECPWVVSNNHNDSIVRHSMKWEKEHNCHMVNGNIWDKENKCQCFGNKKYLTNNIIK